MFSSSMLSLASLLLLPFSALASPISSLNARAGAPITSVKVQVQNLTECGIANISWGGPDGPGIEPFTVMIGQGGFYVGIEEIAVYPNITNTTEVYWIVSQEFATSLIFEVVDNDSKITYAQNLVVEAPSNGTTQEVNGTVTCPLGSGLVNRTVFEAYQAGTLFPGGNGTSSNGTKEYGSA